MKAVVLEEPGSPEGLRLRELPSPELGPRDVLVNVRAAGVCHHDVVVMRGVLRRGIKPNVVLGHEIAGEVAKVGGEVQGVSPGDRVVSILTECCGHCRRCVEGNEHRCLNGHGIGHSVDGGYAEQVRVAGLSLRPIPEGVSFEQAAVCACPIGVVLHAVRDLARPQPGETVVVTGAGGGLGVHGMQIAKLMGARVFAVTSSAEKIERLQELGPDEVVFSPDLDFHWEVLALTDDTGAEVVIDTVGSAAFEPAFQSLAQYGRMVMVGEIAGKEIRLNPANLLFKDARLFGTSGVSRKDLDDALELVRRGQVRPVVTSFPLSDAAKVHQMLLDRQLFGRAVLTP